MIDMHARDDDEEENEIIDGVIFHTHTYIHTHLSRKRMKMSSFLRT
jgi:hypothetical protein